MEKTRPQKFIELVASGENPYRACINAGYSEKYAKNFSGKLLEKYGKEIEEYRPIAKEAIKKNFEYTINDVYRELEEVRQCAMMTDEKGNYTNLNAANKAIENKARLIGAFEADNEQQNPGLAFKEVSKTILKEINQETKQMFDE